MPLRIGFMGFRHAHIFALYNLVRERNDVVLAGVCEEDAATRKRLGEQGITVTYDNVDRFLAETDCEVIGCGDAYGRRGSILIRALESGRHVIGDKPLCTRLKELDRIEELAHGRNLRVGCMLDLPALGPFRTLRRVIQEGAIGEVHMVSFAGQHPLNYGKRPSWYFEEGLHGGTINDIAIHAVDIIPWLTGQAVAEVTAARAWNARLREVPFFQDGAILALRLANGAGVLGDVSYLSPDSFGYSLPYYWRFNVSGTRGHAETWCKAATVSLYRDGSNRVQEEPVEAAKPGVYFEEFLLDLEGKPRPDGLDTERVLRSSRVALVAQAAADTGRFPQPVP